MVVPAGKPHLLNHESWEVVVWWFHPNSDALVVNILGLGRSSKADRTIFHTLGIHSPQPGGRSLALSSTLAMGRCWYSNDTRSRLVMVTQLPENKGVHIPEPQCLQNWIHGGKHQKVILPWSSCSSPPFSQVSLCWPSGKTWAACHGGNSGATSASKAS